MSDDGSAKARADRGLRGGDPRLRGLVICAALGVFAVQLDFFSVQAAVPEMAAELDTTPASLQWVVSGYMLSTAALLIVAGRLADIFGRRSFLVVGAVIFGGASLLGGAASSAEILISMRIVMGAGAAILFPVSLAIVTHAFSSGSVQRAVGLVFAVGAISQAIGPVLGGVVTEAVSWRWVLWVNVPVTAGVVVLALTRVPNSRDESVPRTIDWPGLVLVVVSIATFTYGIDRAADWGWSSASTVAFVAVGVAGLVGFLLVELRVRYPLLDLSLFSDRVFTLMTAGGSVGNTGAVIVIFYSMVYLQDVEGFSAAEAGISFMTFSIGYSIAAVMSGRMEKIAPSAVMSVALAMAGAATVVMGLVAPIWLYLTLAFFSGIGFGVAWSYTSVVTQSIVPEHEAGAASGTVLTVLISVGGVGLAVATSVYSANTSTGASDEGDVIQAILVVVGVVAVLAAPLVALLGRRRAPVQA